MTLNAMASNLHKRPPAHSVAGTIVHVTCCQTPPCSRASSREKRRQSGSLCFNGAYTSFKVFKSKLASASRKAGYSGPAWHFINATTPHTRYANVRRAAVSGKALDDSARSSHFAARYAILGQAVLATATALPSRQQFCRDSRNFFVGGLRPARKRHMVDNAQW